MTPWEPPGVDGAHSLAVRNAVTHEDSLRKRVECPSGEIAERNFPVRSGDPHRFDADGDGIGCED